MWNRVRKLTQTGVLKLSYASHVSRRLSQREFMMWVAGALVALAAAALGAPCGEARARCAYRTGCGAALAHYMLACEGALTDLCPHDCSHALIALTSTDEGKDLMNCECEDSYCSEAKARLDVCRGAVARGAANATASCTLAQLICAADAQCATALAYYHQFCRAVFRGRKCSNKCLNSIDILRKQDKAAALTVCRCDGDEDYDCPRMQANLERLCFRRRAHGRPHHKQRVPPAAPPPALAAAAPAAAAAAALLRAVVGALFCAALNTITC